jgi:hypothetical protein
VLSAQKDIEKKDHFSELVIILPPDSGSFHLENNKVTYLTNKVVISLFKIPRALSTSKLKQWGR